MTHRSVDLGDTMAVTETVNAAAENLWQIANDAQVAVKIDEKCEKCMSEVAADKGLSPQRSDGNAGGGRSASPGESGTSGPTKQAN